MKMEQLCWIPYILVKSISARLLQAGGRWLLLVKQAVSVSTYIRRNIKLTPRAKEDVDISPYLGLYLFSLGEKGVPL
jgi:hypothetical protein